MTSVRKTLDFTQSSDLVEPPSAASFHFALEPSSSDYVEEVSRYRAGQHARDQACDDPAEAESDSGDSLFLTQNPAPEAQRSRQRYHSQRSQPASIRKLEGEDSSSSQEESNTVKKRSGTKGKKFRLPQYSFPFLLQPHTRRARLSIRHNTALHHCAMGGLFKCVKELQQAHQRGDDPFSSLPTVHVEGECIVPLSENEEEGSDSMDIKVVERKRFVFTPSNAKRSQRLKKGSRVNEQKRNAGKGQGTSQGRRGTLQHQISAEDARFSSQAESSDDEGPSQSLMAEREMGDKHVLNNRNIVAHCETATTERRLTRGYKKYIQEKEREEELCDDSDATYCERLEPQRRPGSQETSLDVTDGPADVFLTDDPSQVEQAESEHGGTSLHKPVSDADNESVCNNTRVDKKGNAKEEDDERKGESLEDSGGLRAAPGRTPTPAEENRAELPVMHTHDEPEDLSHDDVIARQEEGGHLESEMRAEEESQSLRTRPVLNGGEDKKTKKKQAKGGVGDETLKSSIDSEPLKDDGEIPTKKKIRKKKKIVNVEKHEEVLNVTSDGDLGSGRQLEEPENIESTLERLEPIVEKKRKKHKKKQRSADQDDVDVGGKDFSLAADESNEENTAKKKTKEKKRANSSEVVSCILAESNKVDDAAHSPKMKRGSDDRAPESVTEKKKKRGSTSQAVDISGTFDENPKVDDSQKTKEGAEDRDSKSVTKKRKKKKRRRESTSEVVDVYCTADKNEEVDVDHFQTINEGSDHRDAESGTKKKKKKKRSEILSRAASDTVEQSDDSVSMRKKARTSSFLDADAEEKDAQTHKEQNWPCSNSPAAPVCGAAKSGVSAGAPETESAAIAGTVEEANSVVRKKKRKRKVSEVEERVQKYCDQDFEEPGEMCESFLPDATTVRLKRKKKSRGNESELSTALEGLGSADSVGCSQTNGAVVLRKKKKKKSKSETDHVTQESFTPATDNVESAVSHKKKGKGSAALSAREERCDAEECCDISDKMRKEKLNESQQASPSAHPQGVTYETVRIKKNKKNKRAKTRLYDPSESLFMDQ